MSEDMGGPAEEDTVSRPGACYQTCVSDSAEDEEAAHAQQSKSPQLSLPPVTSFSWNTISPNSIVTCSIDTTATLWDINTSQALTQLIAHDRAVYDL